MRTDGHPQPHYRFAHAPVAEGALSGAVEVRDTKLDEPEQSPSMPDIEPGIDHKPVTMWVFQTRTISIHIGTTTVTTINA